MTLVAQSPVTVSQIPRVDLVGPWGISHGLSIVNTNLTDLHVDAHVVPHTSGYVSYQGIPQEVARAGALTGIQTFVDYASASCRPLPPGDYYVTDGFGGKSYKLINVIAAPGLSSERPEVGIDLAVSNALSSAMCLFMDTLAMPPLEMGSLKVEDSAGVMLKTIRDFWLYNPHHCPRRISIAVPDSDQYQTFVRVASEVLRPASVPGYFENIEMPRVLSTEGRRLAALMKKLRAPSDLLEQLEEIKEIAERAPSVFRKSDFERFYELSNEDRSLNHNRTFISILELLSRTEGRVAKVAGQLLAKAGKELTLAFEESFRMRADKGGAREAALRERADRALHSTLVFKPFGKIGGDEVASEVDRHYDGITMDGVFGRIKMNGTDVFLRFVHDKRGGQRTFITYARVDKVTYAEEIYEHVRRSLPAHVEASLMMVVGKVGKSELPEKLGGLSMAISVDAPQARRPHDAAIFYRHLVDNMGLEFGRFRG